MLKNMLLFRLRGFNVNDLDVEKAISENAFIPCPSFMMQSAGWVEPYGEGTGFMKKSNGSMLLSYRVDKKTLPKQQFDAMLAKRIEEYTQTTGEEPVDGDLDALRDEIIKALLPTLFAKPSVTTVILNPSARWMIVDAGSWAGARDIASSISRIFDLENVPQKITSDVSPEGFMTSWLREGKINEDFRAGYDCVLAGDDKSKITIKNENLHSKEVLNHINDGGKRVTQLQLDWKGVFAFNVDKNLVIKGLSLGGNFPEIEESDDDEAAAQLDLVWTNFAEQLKQLVEDVLPLIAVNSDHEED